MLSGGGAARDNNRMGVWRLDGRCGRRLEGGQRDLSWCGGGREAWQHRRPIGERWQLAREDGSRHSWHTCRESTQVERFNRGGS